MKHIAHIDAAAKGQNKAIVVKLAKRVVTTTEVDFHACLVCVVVVIAVHCVETRVVDWQRRRRC